MTDDPDDFDWPPVEHDHDQKREVAPAVAPEVVLTVLPDGSLDDLPITIAPPPAPVPAAPVGAHEVPETSSEPSRTATRSVMAALLVGLVCGFGGGYLARGVLPPATDVQRPPASAATPPAPPSTPAPAAREYTEGAIEDAHAAPAQNPGPETGRDSGPVQRQPEPSTPPGRLLVRSTPADAQVFVDGREQGRTPATIRDLALGAHRLRIVLDGYVIQERRFVVTTEQPAQSVSVSLEQSHVATAAADRSPSSPPSAADGTLVGALDVESRPPGARVFLDGMLVGTTPFSSTRIGAGRHAIELECDGYRRWLSSVLIVRGERNRITASLEQ